MDTAATAIRSQPDPIKVSSRPPIDIDSNSAEGEVYDIAYLGDMTVYYVKLGNGLVVKAASLNSARQTDDPLTWNDRAWISFKPDSGVVLTR